MLHKNVFVYLRWQRHSGRDISYSCRTPRKSVLGSTRPPLAPFGPCFGRHRHPSPQTLPFLYVVVVFMLRGSLAQLFLEPVQSSTISPFSHRPRPLYISERLRNSSGNPETNRTESSVSLLLKIQLLFINYVHPGACCSPLVP